MGKHGKNRVFHHGPGGNNNNRIPLNPLPPVETTYEIPLDNVTFSTQGESIEDVSNPNKFIPSQLTQYQAQKNLRLPRFQCKRHGVTTAGVWFGVNMLVAAPICPKCLYDLLLTQDIGMERLVDTPPAPAAPAGPQPPKA